MFSDEKKKRELYRNIQGELWKMRHTWIPVLHILIPVLGILVFLYYYSFAAWSDEGKISGYIQVLSIAFPLIISGICSMSVEMEEKGHFQTFLGVAVNRRNPLLAKWIVLSGMGFAAILLAVLGFAGGFRALSGKAALSAGQYLALACVLWMEGADLYLLHLFLNLEFSKSISLCVGTSELVISALFLTGLGEGRWQYFPCTWGGRWGGYLLQYWMGNGASSAEYMTKSLMIGMAVSLLLWSGIFLWFPSYEGRQSKD
ncbi:MAG: lantibiotic immunity ABC transporter MutG family permease subunit [Dorea sp.]|nr:lantibiotic immunity ABC transporter MutG family permease subunit [Dorea sp.]